MSRSKASKRVIMSAEIEARRKDIVAAGNTCDNLNPHDEHPIEHRMQNWLGGGYEILVCPGR